MLNDVLIFIYLFSKTNHISQVIIRFKACCDTQRHTALKVLGIVVVLPLSPNLLIQTTKHFLLKKTLQIVMNNTSDKIE